MGNLRHKWMYGGSDRYSARNRKCEDCGAIGRRIGYGSVPWDTQLTPDGLWYRREVPACPGTPAAAQAASQPAAAKSPWGEAMLVVDLTAPDVKYRSAEIRVPGGVVRITPGMLQIRTGKIVTDVEIEPVSIPVPYVARTRQKLMGDLSITIEQEEAPS